METIKIKIGTLTLIEARNEDLPQEFAAWHQTVRIEPGTYDVHAYISWSHDGGGGYVLRSLSAECEGVTVSSYFAAHFGGVPYGKDNNRNGKRATAHIRLSTFGVVGERNALLEQTTLRDDVLVRREWDPAEHRPEYVGPHMWRFEWNPAIKPIVIQRPRFGGTALGAFEDTRRFEVDGDEVPTERLRERDVWVGSGCIGPSCISHLSVGETTTVRFSGDKNSHTLKRIA